MSLMTVMLSFTTDVERRQDKFVRSLTVKGSHFCFTLSNILDLLQRGDLGVEDETEESE